MHSRIGDEEGSRWASLIICAEFYTTDEVGGGPGFDSAPLTLTCSVTYAFHDMRSSSRAPSDRWSAAIFAWWRSQSSFFTWFWSRTWITWTGPENGRWKNIQSMKSSHPGPNSCTTVQVLSVAVKSSLSGHKKLLCGENVFEYHTSCLHFDGFV